MPSRVCAMMSVIPAAPSSTQNDIDRPWSPSIPCRARFDSGNIDVTARAEERLDPRAVGPGPPSHHQNPPSGPIRMAHFRGIRRGQGLARAHQRLVREDEVPSSGQSSSTSDRRRKSSTGGT
jgi:hypothetical protein